MDQNHAESILQLSAQANSSKQLVDELVNANIGLRSIAMIHQHHLKAAQGMNAMLESEKEALQSEIASLKEQITKSENQEAAA